MALDPLTATIARDPLTFFRATTVNPPALDAVYRHHHPITIGDRSLRFFSNRPAIDPREWRYSSGQIAPRVAWIRAKEDFVFPNAVTFDVEYAAHAHDPRDYTDVTPEFEQRVDAATRLPVWYLPWDPDHLVRLTIPRYRDQNTRDFGGGVEVDPYNPHLFFTAGLSGCSVFAYGDPRSPTVVHAGTKQGTPYGDESALFWRELLLVERFQRLHHQGVAREVNVDDYMESTPALKNFRAWLKRLNSDFIVERTIPFGSVFGVRYGSLWSFYLQENAVVKRFKLQKRKNRVKIMTGGFAGYFKTEEIHEVEVEVKSPDDYITRPIAVRPFFPQGGQATFWETFVKSYGGV
jgi:hypothetical protein